MAEHIIVESRKDYEAKERAAKFFILWGIPISMIIVPFIILKYNNFLVYPNHANLEGSIWFVIVGIVWLGLLIYFKVIKKLIKKEKSP